jgi:hypothetical protein
MKEADADMKETAEGPISPRVLHPFLYAVTPVLALYSHNMSELSVLDSSVLTRMLLPGVLLLGLAWLLLVMLKVSFKDRHKGGAATTALLLLLTCSGYLHEQLLLLRDWLAAPRDFFELWFYRVGFTELFLLVCACLLPVGLLLIRRSPKSFSPLTRFLNLMFTVPVLLSVLTICWHEGRRALAGRETGNTGASPLTEAAVIGDPSASPSIYYIIMDEYGAFSTLEAHFGYSNCELHSFLQSRGFFIAYNSLSNYDQTVLSLPSSLNMEYLETLREPGRPELRVDDLTELVRNNAVARFLRARGYAYIHFRSESVITERNRYADWDVTECTSRLLDDRFLCALLQPTALQPILDWGAATSKRSRVLCKFDTLADIAKMDGPLFVFAHFMVPHPPFVFGRQGEETSAGYSSRDYDRTLYLNQLIYVTGKLMETIDAILAASDPPPIIVLQSDTGPWVYESKEYDSTHPVAMSERMKILNAFYMPGGRDEQLSVSVTPVNSFRLIFNAYFGTDLEILDNRSYYSHLPGREPISVKRLGDGVPSCPPSPGVAAATSVSAAQEQAR